MNAFLTVSVLAVAFACAALPAAGAELKLGAGDNLQTTLAGQRGVRVTVRVRSGQDITGVVREVGAGVVQLGAVSGKEFYDAVVPLESVDAVFVRVKE